MKSKSDTQLDYPAASCSYLKRSRGQKGGKGLICMNIMKPVCSTSNGSLERNDSTLKPLIIAIPFSKRS